MASDTTGPVTSCQVCKSKKLTEVLSLGHEPIVQEYLTKKELGSPEVAYPLGVLYCARCSLAQLSYIVEPKKVFPTRYPYRTGLTNMLVRNFRELAAELERRKCYRPGDLIVDIGSNDGSLLLQFKERGMRTVGIEPTNAAKAASRNGIETLQAFFSAKVVRSIIKKHGKPRVLTATNVFAHINDTATLMRNIRTLMDKKTVFVSESQYLGDIVDKLEFDTIYHEHLRFYSLKALIYLFRMHALSVIDAERIPAAGGSIRVFVKLGRHPMSERANRILSREKKAGLHDVRTLLKFGEKVYAAKNDLLALLVRLKQKRAKIVGLTSSARSNTLLGFAHIDATVLDYTCEKRGSPKIGLYTPGTHVPVVDESRILKDQPEYLLVLSWHIGLELVSKTRASGYKGKFILPLPVPRVVS